MTAFILGLCIFIGLIGALGIECVDYNEEESEQEGIELYVDENIVLQSEEFTHITYNEKVDSFPIRKEDV